MLVVAVDGASALSTLGVLEVFDVANRTLAARRRPPAYATTLAAAGPEVVTSVGVGLRARALGELQPPHTLVVGGGPDLPSALDPAFVAQVGRLAEGATRVVSVCAGAFVLGRLGLLRGVRCTTHWLWLDALRAEFPEARVESDALYTVDGRVWTSAGVTAGIDLALQLVRTDLGPKVAQTVARALVMFVHRPGGQAQFGAALRLREGADDRLRALISDVVQHPARDCDVPALARRVGMSPRHFARVFLAQTGETPAAFVARARVEAAQRRLADGDASLAAVAEDCGFGTEVTLRRTFARVVGVGPAEWRARFVPRAPLGAP